MSDALRDDTAGEPAAETRTEPRNSEPRNKDSWAAKVDRLHVADDSRGKGFNIEGKRVTGPQQGFGKLWQRTTIADLGSHVTPEQVVADWRAHFGDYWPRGGRFFGGMAGIEPGDVAPLQAGPVTTGIMVLYADDTSFSFLTPEGHMFAAMITFAAEQTDRGTRARVDILLRTSDPLFEAGWFLIKPNEDRFWAGTLRNLARAHGIPNVPVVQTTELVDGRRIWKHWRNVFHNSGIRTVLHTATRPFRRRPRTVAAR